MLNTPPWELHVRWQGRWPTRARWISNAMDTTLVLPEGLIVRGCRLIHGPGERSKQQKCSAADEVVSVDALLDYNE